jgi:hypothetical protein
LDPGWIIIKYAKLVFKQPPETKAAPTMDIHAKSIIDAISGCIDDFEYHRTGCTSRVVLRWIVIQSECPHKMLNLLAVHLGVDSLAMRVASVIERCIRESVRLQNYDLSAIMSRVNGATAPAA